VADDNSGSRSTRSLSRASSFTPGKSEVREGAAELLVPFDVHCDGVIEVMGSGVIAAPCEVPEWLVDLFRRNYQ
jgi:hypothetical protein